MARLVGERPGITVAELARQLSVDATGLYAVVRRLQAEGQITKEGTALRPITATPEPPSATRPEPAAAASTPHFPRRAAADRRLTAPTPGLTGRPVQIGKSRGASADAYRTLWTAGMAKSKSVDPLIVSAARRWCRRAAGCV